jgi:uncharacterized protein YukJ
MTIKYSVYFIIIALAFFNNNPSYAVCEITNRIYKDVDGKGFELRFSEPSSDSAVSFANVTLWHPERNNIGVFEAGASQGLANIYFSLINKKEDNINIAAYFFNSNFQQSQQIDNSHYLFVSGLGSWDWYFNQMSGGRDIFLGNPMWKFDRCQS